MTATDTVVRDAAQDERPDRRPKLVFFYSPHSGRARRAEGFLAQVLQRRQNHDTFTLIRVDVDVRPDLAQRFRVRSTPALVVIDGNRVRARLSEPRGCVDITNLLRPWLT